ncbi:hypothetical protein CYMTET_23226 [Cymbomonas tetramitiformis]|uniref:Protein nlrc3 n=1 Tax=Cymbomonas tetramitiformis TaxID=36881 RepID=A0AAE0L1H9_9CHLO|nr:hypothetical protein CYMTET_23226 [Cymbomonas tetramitiformis]
MGEPQDEEKAETNDLALVVLQQSSQISEQASQISERLGVVKALAARDAQRQHQHAAVSSVQPKSSVDTWVFCYWEYSAIGNVTHTSKPMCMDAVESIFLALVMVCLHCSYLFIKSMFIGEQLPSPDVLEEDVCSHYDNILSQQSSAVDNGAGIVDDRRKQQELKRKQLGKKVVRPVTGVDAIPKSALSPTWQEGGPTCHRRGRDSKECFITNEAKREEYLKRRPEVRDSLMKKSTTWKSSAPELLSANLFSMLGDLQKTDCVVLVKGWHPLSHWFYKWRTVATRDGRAAARRASKPAPRRRHTPLGPARVTRAWVEAHTPAWVKPAPPGPRGQHPWAWAKPAHSAWVLRATRDVKEGVTLDMLDISGCKLLSWDAVRGALPNMGRVGRLRMRGGPLVKVTSGAEAHKLLAELGACTAAASLSMALRDDERGLRHSVDQYLSAILSAAARDLKIEALDLDLVGEETGTEGAMALAAALTPNEQDMFIRSLNTLNLAVNDIGPEGAKALAVALTPNEEGVFNTSLNTLNLEGNPLCGLNLFGSGTYDASGIKALAEALVFNKSLNTLNIEWNGIGPEGAKALADALTPNAEGVFNTSLNTLDMGGNAIRAEGAKALAVALTPNAEGVFNTSLNTLNLWGNKIGPEGAKALAVALTRNAEGVFNTSLNTLYLADNELCGVDFYGRGTYDASGIKALAEALVFNGSLNTLNLYYNRIGDEGAKALAVALTPNAEGVFNTSLNTITITDGVVLPIGALRRNELTELDLSRKRLKPEDVIILGAVLVSNTSLNTLTITDEVDLPIGALRRNEITELDLRGSGSKRLQPEDAIILGTVLAFNTSLNTLDVRHNAITGEAAQQLAEAVLKHPCITEFNKIMMQDIRDDKVTELDLSGKDIGVPGARVLSKLLVSNTSLNTLGLRGNQLCGVAYGRGTYDASGFKALADALAFNGSLNTLNLYGNSIGPEGAKVLAVALTPNAKGVFNTSLNTLDVRHNAITGEAAQQLAEAVLKHPCITEFNKIMMQDIRDDKVIELDLSWKDIGVPGARVLSKLLVSNTSLNTLDLRDNKIRPEGAEALAVALTPNTKGVFNTSLNTLRLGGNRIGSKGAKALAVALTPNAVGVFNGSLSTLNLEGNRIGSKGAKALAVALTPNAEGVFNTSLNTLDLNGNDIGPEGAKALAGALTPNEKGVFNGSLNTLGLRGNQLCGVAYGRGTYDASGFKALADALAFNGSLNTLNLYGNSIGPEGAKVLAVALTPIAKGVFNTSLNTLNLGDNQIGDEGAKALAVALTPNAEGVFNGSLDTLNLGYNNLGDEGKAAVQEAIRKHPNAATFKLHI